VAAPVGAAARGLDVRRMVAGAARARGVTGPAGVTERGVRRGVPAATTPSSGQPGQCQSSKDQRQDAALHGSLPPAMGTGYTTHGHPGRHSRRHGEGPWPRWRPCCGARSGGGREACRTRGRHQAGRIHDLGTGAGGPVARNRPLSHRKAHSGSAISCCRSSQTRTFQQNS
jgi:hypothetical protein